MNPTDKSGGLSEPCAFDSLTSRRGPARTMTTGDTPGSRRRVLHRTEAGTMYPPFPPAFSAESVWLDACLSGGGIRRPLLRRELGGFGLSLRS